MTIIDSRVRSYEANTPKRPWHSVPHWPAAQKRLSSLTFLPRRVWNGIFGAGDRRAKKRPKTISPQMAARPSKRSLRPKTPARRC